MSGTQLGYEYKRILSQNAQTGEVSELADVTKAAAERAVRSGNGGWVRAVMRSLKRMADWLRGAGGRETARQPEALHAELAKIIAGEGAPPRNAPNWQEPKRPLDGNPEIENPPAAPQASSHSESNPNESEESPTPSEKRAPNVSQTPRGEIQQDGLAPANQAPIYHWHHDVPLSRKNALNRLARVHFKIEGAGNGTYMRNSEHITKATDGLHTTGPNSDRPTWQRATEEAATRWASEHPGKRPNVKTIRNIVQKLKERPEFVRQYDKTAPARLSCGAWKKMESSAKQSHAQAVIALEEAKRARMQQLTKRQ